MGERGTREIPSKDELVERIEAAWVEVERLLVDLDAEQMARKPQDGGWAIKDLLAHLAVWVNSAVALLAGRNRPEAMGIDAALWETGEEHEINAEIERIWAERSAADALAALRTAQAELREQLSALTEADLARPYSHFQPDDPPYNPKPVVGWIEGNTYGHVEMHLSSLRELREQVS